MPESRTTPAFGDLHSSSGPEIVVVLVEPGDARNIGAVARAMSNLSVHKLRLVQAAEFDTVLADGVACWGKSVLADSTRHSCLSDAVADCHEVVGFASDSGRHRVPQLLLDDWVDKVERSPEHRVAFVFGSEENGLGREHFPLCQYLIRIPSNGENRSYNLAQSVLLALYALRVRSGNYVGATQPEWPVSGQIEPFTQMVLKVAEDVGFLNEHSPAHIQDLIINLTRRGRVTTRELKILTGLVGMISRSVARRDAPD